MATIALGGFLAAVLMRMAPGAAVDERELDPRLGQASLERIRAERSDGLDPARFSWKYGRNLLSGDLGISISFRRPVSELIGERAAVTGGLLAAGLAGGWALALAAAIPASRPRARGFSIGAGIASGGVACVPSGALALLLFAWNGPVRAVMALAIFPRLFESVRKILRQIWDQPHVLTARSKGLGDTAILVRHVMPVAAPQILATFAVSVNTAMAVAIPVETIGDFAGIGQLAWKAALGRDLPLLVSLTLMIAAVTVTCSAVAELASSGEARA